LATDPFRGRKIRFGIVGCGAIGPTHAGAIAQIADAELVAVADPLVDRANGVGEKFNLKKIYSDQMDLLSDPDVDVACFCTPSGMHGDGAVAGLSAGKHVIVEKPMEISVAACERMIDAQKKSGKLLTVISQHRFDAASQRVKQLIDTGALGKIILATADVKWWRTQNYYDGGDWRGTWAMDGGGAVMNQGVHTVDLLQWLVGDVETIYAKTRTAGHERIEVEDTAVAMLVFKNGAIGTFVATTAAYDGLPVRIDIFGTAGTAIIEGDVLKLLKLKTGETLAGEAAAAHAVSVASGGTASVKHETVARAPGAQEGAVWGDAHRAQIEDFIRALRTGGKPLIDGPAGAAPVRIILGMYESARQNAEVRMVNAE
jgi:UDP-N-acetyl-2-amino-2-deoxyglucuronate dehydrogenase